MQDTKSRLELSKVKHLEVLAFFYSKNLSNNSLKAQMVYLSAFKGADKNHFRYPTVSLKPIALQQLILQIIL